MNRFIVITTINEKTKAIVEFEKINNWKLVIVGDKKSKSIKNNRNLIFLSVDDQKKLGFSIVDKLPYNHYTRKNIGYLFAIREGADVIYDTDDDNIPYPFWNKERFECRHQIQGNDDFVNIYNYFCDELIWPRGFPLDLVNKREDLTVKESPILKIGVWQGLADLAPDVDAIYRLIFNKSVSFERKAPVFLPAGKYCPFNSQNTFWSRESYPFLYLPATTSFRYTDILRSFIAQRLLWTLGLHLGFHLATVYQERNFHDIMQDFKDELECYFNTRKVINVLQTLDVTNDSFSNLSLAYQALHDNRLISSNELPILEAWQNDLVNII